MAETKSKFVEFNRYCKDCKYKELKETVDPCNECLTQPVNVDSHKPINFEKKS